MAKYFYIYKIINKVNNHFYIGQHTTDDLDDGYMGSGTVLRRAFKKYGAQNFEKKILGLYKSKDELNIVEKRLVSNKFLQSSIGMTQCYNVHPGGAGGFQCGLWKGKKRSAAFVENMRNKLKGHPVSQHTREAVSKAHKGTKHSKEHIEKARVSLKKTLAKQGTWNKGKQCPQLSGLNNGGGNKFRGTHYYNNGIMQIRARECPNGFVKGGLKKDCKSKKDILE